MKKTKLTRAAALFVAIATFTITSSNALTAIQVRQIRDTVLGVPVPEMPAKAAELVNKAEKKDRQATAVTAVRAVVMKHRAAAPLVVSAVSKAAPEIAPQIALAAAEIVKDQATVIAHAAAVSAPAQAQEIIKVISPAVPTQAASVASSVNAISTRGSALQGGNSGGFVVVTPTPINSQSGGAGNGQFSFTGPKEAANPVVLYNQPPQP